MHSHWCARVSDPGSGTFLRTSAGGSDIYVLKLSSSGNFSWVETFGSTGGEAGWGIDVDPGGTVHVAGFFSETIDFDPDPLAEYSLIAGDMRHAFLLRLGAILTGAVLGPLAVGLQSASADPQPRLRWPWGSQPRLKAPGTAPQKNPCTSFCKRCRTKKQQTQCVAACRACGNDPSRLSGSCGTYTCVDLSSDPNCGAVGNDCGAMGLTCCGGACADVNNDATNCGACGHACAGSTPYCINGTCSQCAPGQTKCGTACVYLAGDANNCGACGNACPTGTSCVNGTCSDGGHDCPEGTAWCGGGCIDVMWDGRNCGACGAVCPEQTACAWGVCEGICIGCG